MARNGDRLQREKSLFFRHWLRNPLGIGAVLPSGAPVGRAMAREIALDRSGAILELGGGTGGLTRGLLGAGIPAERLVIVEREPDLAAALRGRFPMLRVIEADARGIRTVLARLEGGRLAAVVSSLPIKWFPLPAQRAILESCLDALGAGGPFLQMTNALTSPVPIERLGIVGEEVARIWGHLPPVQIWRYWRPAS